MVANGKQLCSAGPAEVSESPKPGPNLAHHEELNPSQPLAFRKDVGYIGRSMSRAYASYFGFSYRFWGFALER